jgi:paired amphipathic helix protein Sin3a
MRLLDSLEEYDGILERRNVFEEALAKVEDERFEVDIVIETNGSAMKQIEPYAEEVSMLRENEEKEGQPIGRLRYELRPKSLHSNHLNAIARLYGEQGDEVLHHLLRNPIAVLPIVFKRLKEKDTEWRKVRTDLCKQWRSVQETNFEPSLDVTSYFKRRDIEKSFHNEDLIEDCQKARQFAKEPPIMPSVTDKISATFSFEHENQNMLLFQSHTSVAVTPEMPHKDAYELISLYTVKNVAKTNSEREKIARVWTEFMLPWFNSPTHWFLKELRDKARSEKSSGIVKYALGQMVKTAFGNGRIVSFVEAGSYTGAHYKVKFPFGTGYIRPSSIVHHLPPQEQVQYVRSGGFMELFDAADNQMDGDEVKLLPSSCQLIFGTEKVYLFMRMYCALVGLLGSIKNDLSASSDDMDIEGNDNKGYAGFLSIIKKYIEEKYSFKTYELQCRSLLKTKPYEMAAVPRLLDKCADFIVKVAKEDKVLLLYDFYQLKHMNPTLQRNQSLDLTDEAVYRIQFEASDGNINFSYMPKSRDLHMTPRGDDGSITSEGEDNTGGEEDDLDSVIDGDEVLDDSENGVKAAKRMKLD